MSRLILAAILLLSTAPARAEPGPTGMEWARLLAGGDAERQVSWALRYAHAEGVPRDHEKALALYCAAGSAGHAAAQFQLGWTYANGRGVARDDALARAWFRRAAGQGDAHAARMLALIPGDGEDVAARCGRPGRGGAAVAGGGEADRERVQAWIRRLAPDHGLGPELVIAVVEAESAFDRWALSEKGAMGLMQLIPATAERFDVVDPWDPVQNLDGGMAYLAWLLELFDNELELALAGYNAGENAVLAHGGVPPYRETREYVARITARLERSNATPVVPVAYGADPGR